MARNQSRAMTLMSALNVAPPGMAGPRVGLVASAPADRAVELVSPAAVGLRFSGAVRLTAFAVTDEAGARADGGFSIALVPAVAHSVSLPPLPAGTYTVAWRARPADRQPIGGTFRFAVAGS
ncbi:MAG: copper resistance CopC family protein [Alphaproteobacteria bacterium]